MFLTYIHSIVRDPFPEILIHVPCIGYFVQPVFPPFLICVVFGRRKLSYTDSFGTLHSQRQHSYRPAGQFKIVFLTTLMAVHLFKTKTRKISRRFLHASHSYHLGTPYWKFVCARSLSRGYAKTITKRYTLEVCRLS